MGCMLEIEQYYTVRVRDRGPGPGRRFPGQSSDASRRQWVSDPFDPGNASEVLTGSDSFSCISESGTPFYSLARFRKDAKFCRLFEINPIYTENLSYSL